MVNADLSSVAVYPSDCLTCDIVREIVCRRDSVYVGSTGGLLFIDTQGTPSNFSDDKRIKIFQETSGLISNNVITIAVTADHIWVGTDEGITRFTKNFNPDSTFNYTTVQGLLNNHVNKITAIDTMIYVASDSGLNLFNGIGFDSLVLHRKVIDVIQIGDSLGLALDSVSQFGFYYNDSLTIRNSGLIYRSKPQSLLYTDDGTLYCGLGNRWVADKYGDGIWKFAFTTNTWDSVYNNCLPLNQICDVAATELGIFAACSDRSSQYARGLGWLHDDNTWTKFNRDTVLSTNLIHRCKQAPDGRLWLGVNTFSRVGGDTFMLFSFDPNTYKWDSYPRFFLNMDSTCAVWDLEFDNSNNMYLALPWANRLYVIDSGLTKAYYLGLTDARFIVEIAVDSSGRIWRTRLGDTKGLLLIDTKNTLFNRNDDLDREISGLPYNNCYGCIVDQQGVLYIANDRALVQFDDSFSTVYSNPEDEFFDLELDSYGRIWAMARHGLYCYDPYIGSVEQYTYSNMHVDVDFVQTGNEVIQLQGFEFDSLRHCFWIGNNNGLLKLTIESETATIIDSIIVYPNPAVRTSAIHIKKLPSDATVNIYSITGRLLAEDLEIDPFFNEVIWHFPDNISSGLYFAVIRSHYGHKVVKFAIVR